MCSYHNGNRLYLPHDPDLLQSLLLILKNEDDYELHHSRQLMLDGADEKPGVLAEGDAAEDSGASSGFLEFSAKRLRLINKNEIAGVGGTSEPLDSNKTSDAPGDTAEYNWANSGFSAVSAMWLKQANENEVAGLGNPLKPWDCNVISDAKPLYNVTHRNLSCPEGNEADASQNERMADLIYQLERQKLKLESKVLKLEKQGFKWKHNSWKQDVELDKMRLENERLKLGNACIAMHLKRRSMHLERG